MNGGRKVCRKKEQLPQRPWVRKSTECLGFERERAVYDENNQGKVFISAAKIGLYSEEQTRPFK